MPADNDNLGLLRKSILLVALIFSSVVFSYKASAQSTSGKSDSLKADSVKQLDFIDFEKFILRIHHSPKLDTAKVPPGRVLFAYIPAFGYTIDAGVLASLSLNLSFYAGDESNTNLSVINTGGQYSIHNQLVIPVISNIWSKGNKFDYLGNLSYYSFPTYTFGLGSNTSLANYDHVYFSYLKLYQEALRHFNSNYFFGFGYYMDYHFNITDNTPITDFPQYNGTTTKTISSGLVVHFIYDSRTNINNPKDAFYGSIIYRSNSTLLGSDQNWQAVLLEARKYFRLAPNVVWAFWTWNEFTFGGQAPYFDLPSNGWDTYSNTGRGYIQGRFRGPDMVYGETELRFRILKNGLLGGVIFANATSVTDWPNVKFYNIFPGEGVGLRLKFNKFSDVNICADYAFGVEGSRGFFFNLGEVF